MADTPNFSFNLPIVRASNDTWGELLNENWSDLDRILQERLAAIEQTVEENRVAAQIPVGGLYLSIISQNPFAVLRYGLWERYAEGLALVGAGNNGESNWLGGVTRGSETHQLTIDELPAHNHPDNFSVATRNMNAQFMNGEINRPIITGGENTSRQRNAGQATDRVIDLLSDSQWNFDVLTMSHDHDLNGGVQTRGEDAPHNNIQPSIAIFVYRRVS